MSNFQRVSKKLPQQLINEKLANDLKLSDKFQKRFSRKEVENNYENIIKAQNSEENLFDESYEYNDKESSNRQQIPQNKQQQLDRVSPLSKTPDSIDDWTNSSANSSTINTAPYRTHYHSNNSSVSPSSESLKRGAGISSGIGTQSDNEMLDEYSTDDIGEDIEIIEEDLPDEEDDDDDDEEEYYGDDDNFEENEQEKIRNLQIEAEKLKNSKVVKQAPLPPLPKLNDIQRHLNDFFNQIITNEKPYNAKLANLINFRNELQNHCTDDSADLRVLFTHVEQIFEQHNLFLNELKKILSDLLRNDLLNLLLNALNVFSVMLSTSLKLYCDFLDNYPRAMVILNKFENEKYQKSQILTNNLKHSQPQHHRQQQQQISNKRTSFIECEYEFSQNNYYTNNELFDTAQIFSNDLLNHPLSLVKCWLSLKDECLYFIRLSKNNDYRNETELNQRIKRLFDDNQEYNLLKDEIFSKIDRVLLPNRIRKNEDVVESCESGEKKLRHLILFGDCLICCRIKKFVFSLDICKTRNRMK